MAQQEQVKKQYIPKGYIKGLSLGMEEVILNQVRCADAAGADRTIAEVLIALGYDKIANAWLVTKALAKAPDYDTSAEGDPEV